jgi:hypothetical protein
MIRDGIGCDLFEVLFNDNLCMALNQYVTSEDIVKFRGDTTEYDVIGSRFVMKHSDLSKIMANMAIE